MSRLRSKFVWTGIFALCAVLPISTERQDPREFPPAGPPTCDASQIDADSYALTTRAMARIEARDGNSR